MLLGMSTITTLALSNRRFTLILGGDWDAPNAICPSIAAILGPSACLETFWSFYYKDPTLIGDSLPPPTQPSWSTSRPGDGQKGRFNLPAITSDEAEKAKLVKLSERFRQRASSTTTTVGKTSNLRQA